MNPRRCAFAVCATLVIAPSLLALPAASAAPTLSPVTFTAATQSLTSSANKNLTVAISANSISVPTPAQRAESVTVAVAHTGAPELHTWQIPLTDPNDFSWDTDGTGVLNTSTSMKPYGSLALTLTAAGPTQVVGCGRTRTDNTPVNVTGNVTFNTLTGTSGWGSVNAKSLTFAGASTIAVADPADKLCGSGLPPCAPGMSWQSFNPLPESGFVQLIGTPTSIVGTRLKHLATPVNATRSDTTSATISNTTFSFSGTDASVVAGPSGTALTGTATLTSTSENAMPPLACGAPGQLSATTQWAANYTNAQPALSLNDEVYPDFTVTDNTTATITRVDLA